MRLLNQHGFAPGAGPGANTLINLGLGGITDNGHTVQKTGNNGAWDIIAYAGSGGTPVNLYNQTFYVEYTYQNEPTRNMGVGLWQGTGVPGGQSLGGFDARYIRPFFSVNDLVIQNGYDDSYNTNGPLGAYPLTSTVFSLLIGPNSAAVYANGEMVLGTLLVKTDLRTPFYFAVDSRDTAQKIMFRAAADVEYPLGWQYLFA